MQKATVAKVHNEAVYYFVKGHDVFQLIDVYIFPITENEEFSVKLVKDSWSDLVEKQISTQRKDGIINFKLRTWGDFGFKILPVKKEMGFAIIVKASPPVKNYLESPFFKAAKANTESDKTNDSNRENGTTKDTNNQKDNTSNFWLYTIIGVFVLATGLLIGKDPRAKKSVSILLFLLLSNIPPLSAQPLNPVTWTLGEVRNGVFGTAVENFYKKNFTKVKFSPENLKKGLEGFGKAVDIYRDTLDFYQSYKGLSSCINSVPLPDAPRLPSFCTTDECDSCFREARQKFNFTRYQFEKLSAIYNCTIDYSKKAISLGDNVSGLHAVSGLAWQIQRRNIEKSVDELKQAYDNRYQILLTDLQDSMQKLNRCEAAHGLPDWYDRFGYLYYDFIKLKYQRDK